MVREICLCDCAIVVLELQRGCAGVSACHHTDPAADDMLIVGFWLTTLQSAASLDTAAGMTNVTGFTLALLLKLFIGGDSIPAPAVVDLFVTLITAFLYTSHVEEEPGLARFLGIIGTIVSA